MLGGAREQSSEISTGRLEKTGAGAGDTVIFLE